MVAATSPLVCDLVHGSRRRRGQAERAAVQEAARLARRACILIRDLTAHAGTAAAEVEQGPGRRSGRTTHRLIDDHPDGARALGIARAAGWRGNGVPVDLGADA